MIVGVASDHHGVELKEAIKNKLRELDCQVSDFGTDTSDPVDYPDKAFKLGEAIQKKEIDLGIAICKSGIGMSIALNKVKDVRCAKVSTSQEAISSKEHNNATAIAISAELNQAIALNIVQKFITTPYSNEDRHNKRIDKITVYEMRSKNVI